MLFNTNRYNNDWYVSYYLFYQNKNIVWIDIHCISMSVCYTLIRKQLRNP